MYLTAEQSSASRISPLRYWVYGLAVRSDWSLPCAEGSGPAIISLELVRRAHAIQAVLPPDLAQTSNCTRRFWHACLPGRSIYLHYPDFFEFLVSADGQRIEGRSLADSTGESFFTYLLGQVLSFALLRQGIEPMHATVLAMAGRAVALLGDCGYGKSTLAAGLLATGHSLLTDDLLVLKEEGGGFSACPGLPRIKLLPETARVLLGDQAYGTPMNPHTAKLILPVRANQVCADVLPLQAIYVLRPPAPGRQSKRVTIRTIHQRSAAMTVIANTFNRAIREPDRLARQFRLAGRLAAAIPFKSLSYPRDLSRLPEVVEAIQSDLARSGVE
jgi:hypothetical protein